jgi:hypothetical protein
MLYDSPDRGEGEAATGYSKSLRKMPSGRPGARSRARFVLRRGHRGLLPPNRPSAPQRSPWIRFSTKPLSDSGQAPQTKRGSMSDSRRWGGQPDAVAVAFGAQAKAVMLDFVEPL